MVTGAWVAADAEDAASNEAGRSAASATYAGRAWSLQTNSTTATASTWGEVRAAAASSSKHQAAAAAVERSSVQQEYGSSCYPKQCGMACQNNLPVLCPSVVQVNASAGYGTAQTSFSGVATAQPDDTGLTSANADADGWSWVLPEEQP